MTTNELPEGLGPRRNPALNPIDHIRARKLLLATRQDDDETQVQVLDQVLGDTEQTIRLMMALVDEWSTLLVRTDLEGLEVAWLLTELGEGAGGD